jgi:hypothetical protein
MGIKKLAASMFMPVRALMVAAPPRINIAVTMSEDKRPKKRNVKWAFVPQRHCTTCPGRSFQMPILP